MKLWKDMTPEEKGALLLAYHEGKGIQFLTHMSREWEDCRPSWFDNYAYRVKPEPKKPREFWLWVNFNKIPLGQFNKPTTLNDVHSVAGDEIIHVREVLE